MSLVSLALMTVLATATADGAVAFRTDAQVTSRDVRLGDIADLSSLPLELRARAADLPLLHLAAGAREIRIPESLLTERARAQMPALARYLPSAPVGQVTIRFDAAGDEPARQVLSPGEPCMVVLSPIAAGVAPRAEDLQSAPCGEVRPARAFSFDRTARVARALRALHPGETVAAIAPSSLTAVRPGDAYVVTARSGPVVVQRQVVAVQPAKPGQSMFVKGADGEVFAAPAPTEVQP